MGTDSCLGVMYDRQFTKGHVCLINRPDPTLLYWHHDRKILLTFPMADGTGRAMTNRARATFQVIVYGEYTEGLDDVLDTVRQTDMMSLASSSDVLVHICWLHQN